MGLRTSEPVGFVVIYAMRRNRRISAIADLSPERTPPPLESRPSDATLDGGPSEMNLIELKPEGSARHPSPSPPCSAQFFVITAGRGIGERVGRLNRKAAGGAIGKASVRWDTTWRLMGDGFQ